MALTQTQQIKKLLEDKKHILVTFGANAGGDALASALALLSYFVSLGKRVDVVSHDFVLPSQFQFLKYAKDIHTSVSDLKTFIITLDVKEAGVQELSYDLVGEKLRIFVTPKQGVLTQNNVKTAETNFKYDLIFVVGTQDFESLGQTFERHPTLFHKTPVVNIDHEASNERHGHINVVDITATSTAEVVYELLRELGVENIDVDVATALLTGMISKTQSFKVENVKPHTLSIAGKLIRMGADRDFIVKNLYRTRSISALKLWGQALTHLQSDKSLGLVWTSVTRDDFARSGATIDELHDIVDELISTSPEAKMILVLYENEEHGKAGVTAVLHTAKQHDALGLIHSLNPHGTKRQATTTFQNKTLKEVEEIIFEEIKKHHIQE